MKSGIMQVLSSEGLKTFGAMKVKFNARSVCLGVKRELYKSVVVTTVTHGAQTFQVTCAFAIPDRVLEF